MKPTFRYLALALFTFLQACIAMADAPLIWGPSNTAKLLNSGELVGKNGDIYLHSAVPLIFPAANAKGPLINNGTGTLSWLVGNTNSFVGFDSTGDMISIPGYTWDQTTQALNANTNFDPFVNGYTAYSLNANSLPTADNSNGISVLNTFTNCGGDDSGFSCGDPATGAGGLNGINSGVNSTNKSSVGHTQLFNGYSQFGNGTDPITVHDMSGISIGETLGTGVSMVYANQFTSNMQAQAGSSLSNFAAFSEQSFLTHLLQNYSGIQINPNITTIDGYYNAYGDNSNLTTVHGGYNSANFSPIIGSVSGTYNGISISPNVVSSALTAEQFQITAVADVAQSLASKYLTFCEPYTNGGTCWAPWFKVSGTGTDPMVPGYTMVEVDIATGDTAATVGTALYNAVNALTVNLLFTDTGTGTVDCTATTAGQANQVNAQDSGFAVVMTAFGGGDGQAVALSINMGNATGFADGNVKAIDTNGNVTINGKLQTGTNAPMTDQGGSQANPVNTINTNFTVAPGVTVNNADMFGFGPIANLTMGANSHANASPGLGVGASSLGMIGLITMDNGSTATNVNGSFIAQVLVGGTGAGGVIDDMNAYRAVSANFGSPTTVTNSRAFLADDTLGAPATNHWGFYAKSSFENYMGKSLKIGGTAGSADKVSNSSVGLEIDPTLALLPDPMTTTVRDSLTPLTGMLVNNSTTNQLERYDGAAWVAVGGFTGTTGSVPFVGGGGSLTEDNTKFFWDDSQFFLGLGNNSPDHALTISSNQPASIQVNNSVSSSFSEWQANVGGAAGRLVFTGPTFGDSDYGPSSLVIHAEDTNGDVRIYPGQTASHQTMFSHTGNVGIGTSSPSFTLDVVQHSNSGLRVTNNNSGELAGLLAWNDLGHYASHAATGSSFPTGLYGPDKAVFYGSGFSNGTVFLSDNGPLELASATAVNLTMTQAGNIGIGTTVPATKLDVAGKFQVDSNGNPLKVNNVATSFPAAQGAANTLLTNDGSGSLSWTAPGTSVGGPTVTASNTFANGNTYTNDIVNPPPYIAQRFTATHTANFVSYETKMQNFNGPTGVVLQAELWSDNGLGGPNSDIGSLLASSITTLSDSTLLTNALNNNATSSVPSSIYNFSGYPVVSGTKYWVVVRKISGSLGANQIFALTNNGTTSPPARTPGNAGGFTPTTYFKANVVVGNQFVLSNALNYLDSSFLNYNVNFGGNVLSGVSTPLTSTDVANKAYVDGLIPSPTWTASGSNQYSNVAGNVGIGSTTPAQKFDIAGKFQVDSNGNPLKINNVATSFPSAQGLAGTILTNDGSGGLTWGSAGGSGPWQVAGSDIYNNNAGNVGVGTSSPLAKLTVSNGASVGGSVPTGSAFTVSGTGNSNRFVTADGNKTLNFQVTGASNYGELSSYDFGINAAFPFYLNANGGNVGIGALAAESQLTVTGNASVGTGYNNSPAPTNGMIVEGNVGIGTSSPTYSLDILQNSVNGIRTKNTVSSQSGGLLAVNDLSHSAQVTITGSTQPATLYGPDKAVFYGAGAQNGTILISDSGPLQLATAAVNFTMLQSGNIGIGNLSPMNKFGVSGNVAIGSYAGSISAPANSIIVSGNVGIGTSSPATSLDVAGKFQVDSNGNILEINNVATSFPSSQGAASTVLTNNGSGALSWTAPAAAITSLTGEATGSGPGATAVTLDNASVIQKVLTGFGPTAGQIAATDNIIQAAQKNDANWSLQFFGDGSDGAFSAASGTTTLTRDMYYSSLTLTGTGILRPVGFKVFVSGTCNLAGAQASAINFNGNSGGAGATAGTGGTGGANVQNGSIAGSTAGVAGGAGGTAAGVQGGAGSATAPQEGGANGATLVGGTGSGGAGGAARTAVSPSGALSIHRWMVDTIKGISLLSGGISGNAGNGGGGDGTSGAGGGGSGAGSGNLWLSCQTINRDVAGTSGVISVNGGAGGNGGSATAGNRGGGSGASGAGGGWAYIAYRYLTGTAQSNFIQSNGNVGGAGGAGFGTGTGGGGGGGGNGGRITLYNVQTGMASETFTGTGSVGGAASGVTGGTAGTAGINQVSL